MSNPQNKPLSGGRPPRPRVPLARQRTIRPQSSYAGTSPRRSNFKTLRIAILLLVLLVVALQSWQDRYFSTRWRDPLYVAIYPIAADESPVTKAYLAALGVERFKPIDRLFKREAARYRLDADEPVRTRLRTELREHPPQRAAHAGILDTAFWSLRLRYWAWRVSGHAHELEDIRIFVLYHDPALTPTVPHSLGLTKGLIGVVYAFAASDMNGANNVVIAHELLHTLGASDKYDTANDMPRFPEGYGDPAQRPLYPQLRAELMAGRVMLAPDRWQQAASLDDVVIGPATALELRWPQHAH